MIILHTIAALTAFGAGAYAWLASPEDKRLGRVMSAYLAGLVLLTAFLVGAVAARWSVKETTERVMDGVLLVLALYMIWRGLRARTELHRLGSGWQRRYMRDIGFTLVALWAAFVIILVLDLGAPIWLVLLSAVLAIAIGHRFIRTVEARRNVDRPAS
jgi:uncharacterized membrane protein